MARYPALKISFFESNALLKCSDTKALCIATPIGHHNDYCLSSANDVGSYNHSGLTMDEEAAYLESDTLHTLFGG